MDKKITFRGMESSGAIENQINEQLSKIEKFLEHENSPILIHMVVESGRTHAHHQAELIVKTPHYDLFCDYEAPDMYDAINRVIDTMYRQLTEKKKELVEKRQGK